MKLNATQTAIVAQLVKNEVEFKETYFELYDHVLTALESRNTLPDIQKAYSDIIEEDFGGHRGLAKLEMLREREFRKNINRKKWNYFGEVFTWPGILIAIPLLMVNYYSIHNNRFKLLSAFIALAAMILPMLVIIIRNFIVGLKGDNGSTKKSIKDNSLNAIAAFIWVWYWRVVAVSTILGVLTSLFSYKIILFPAPFGPILFSVIFWFCVLNAFAVFKVFWTEFKTQLT